MYQTDNYRLLVAANESYSATFDNAGLGASPDRKIALLTCMDARMG